MAKYYTRKEMVDILKQIGYQPDKDGAINTKEAAKVLTWRAKEEYKIDYEYSEIAVRRRISTGALVPVQGRNKNNRHNTYKIEDIFSLPLYPTRGSGQKKDVVS